mmetsp:Transcript_6914/g.21608  ORF Transcript_6914/g.21608 Transcript_6914/m.21608 type:complete len:231 (+) Transcript_6914:1926-2618(+)
MLVGEQLAEESQGRDGAHVRVLEGAYLLEEATLELQAQVEELHVCLRQRGLCPEDPVLKRADSEDLGVCEVVELRQEPRDTGLVWRTAARGDSAGRLPRDGQQRGRPHVRLQEAQPQRFRHLQEEANLLTQRDLHWLPQQRVKKLLELLPPLLDEEPVLLADEPLRGNGRQGLAREALLQLDTEVVELGVAPVDRPDLAAPNRGDTHVIQRDGLPAVGVAGLSRRDLCGQ